MEDLFTNKSSIPYVTVLMWIIIHNLKQQDFWIMMRSNDNTCLNYAHDNLTALHIHMMQYRIIKTGDFNQHVLVGNPVLEAVNYIYWCFLMFMILLSNATRGVVINTYCNLENVPQADLSRYDIMMRSRHGNTCWIVGSFFAGNPSARG